jgi:hypothetical protein
MAGGAGLWKVAGSPGAVPLSAPIHIGTSGGNSGQKIVKTGFIKVRHVLAKILTNQRNLKHRHGI